MYEEAGIFKEADGSVDFQTWRTRKASYSSSLGCISPANEKVGTSSYNTGVEVPRRIQSFSDNLEKGVVYYPMLSLLRSWWFSATLAPLTFRILSS